MRFSQVNAVRIPNGNTRKISHDGKTLWTPIAARYVSLGDSIAAHSGGSSQYGVNGNTESYISSGSYTKWIHRALIEKYCSNVSAVSFARSGDKVEDLMEKLNHEVVQKALAKADYVTVCIGANDILGTVPGHLENYITVGDSALAELTADVNANLSALADDSNVNSITALINKLKSINPNAQYVFTTIYNPYKYLWVDEGRNGFFGPLLDTIPDMSLFGLDVDGIIKDQFLGTDIIETFFDRINGLDDLVEVYVTNLNNVLRNKLAGHANFSLAETKTLYEVFPDRPVAAEKHYNDLVNVEYTRSWNMGDIHWGRLWDDDDEPDNAAEFWAELIVDHVSLSGVDVEGVASDFLALAGEKVIAPDIDPHPTDYGQYVMARSFLDAFGIRALDRHTITYNANGGTGTMAAQTVVGVDSLPAFIYLDGVSFSHSTGYYFKTWNTVSSGGGTSYKDGQYISITSDMTLYAQWTGEFTIQYYKIYNADWTDAYPPESNSGPVTKDGSEYYLRVTVNGSVLPGLGDCFTESGDVSPTRSIVVPAGAELYIQLINKGEYDRGAVYVNDQKVAGNSEYCYYTMNITNDMTITFTWETENNLIYEPQSYWICRIYTQ